MTVFDLWNVCPESHIFLVFRDKVSGVVSKKEYNGSRLYSNSVVRKVSSKVYPIFKSVIEVEIA